MSERNALVEAKRQMDQVAAMLAEGGEALPNVECRLADLQDRFLKTPAAGLADIEARLEVIRDVVASLGKAGYLHYLVNAALDDVRRLRAASGAD